MRRSSYTRPPGGSMMTPLRVSNRDNLPSTSQNTGGARRSSSTTRSSTGSGAPPVKRPRVQKVAPQAPPPRRSSIFGNGRLETGSMKDPRSLGDRNNRDKAIRKIVEFLVAEGYPHKVTPRTLATPNTKDVVSIYNFLFTYLDQDYKSKGKPEEEIPRMLAMMDYPFQLSRNHMFTVAAQHSWPHVLGGLAWIVDCVLTTRNVDVLNVMFPREEDFTESEKEVLSMHLVSAYQDYMSGTDDFTPHEQLLREKMRERWRQGGNSVEKLQEKHRRLKEQAEEIRNDPNTLEARHEHVTMLQTDIESHSRYVQQMTALHDQVLKQIHALDQLRESQSSDLDKICEERDRKQAIIDAQGISPSDVQRMNAQTQELAAQIRLVEEQNSRLNDQVCDAEIKLSRRREAGDARCSEVNNMVRKCFNATDADKLQLQRGADIHQITACFEKITLEVRNRVHKTESERDKSTYKLEMAREKEDDLQKDLQVKQSANKTQADEHERFMKCEREDMDKMQAVLDDLQQQIDVVMATQADDDDGAVDKIKRECDARVASAKSATRQYADFLHKSVAVAADHKLKMKEVFQKIDNAHRDPKLQPFKKT